MNCLRLLLLLMVVMMWSIALLIVFRAVAVLAVGGVKFIFVLVAKIKRTFGRGLSLLA
jgi:hypothetical protein